MRKVGLILLVLLIITGCSSSKDYTKINEKIVSYMDSITTKKLSPGTDDNYKYKVEVVFTDEDDNEILAIFDETGNLINLSFRSEIAVYNALSNNGTQPAYVEVPDGYYLLDTAFVEYVIFGGKEEYKSSISFISLDNKTHKYLTNEHMEKAKENINKIYGDMLLEIGIKDDQDLIDYLKWYIEDIDLKEIKLNH